MSMHGRRGTMALARASVITGSLACISWCTGLAGCAAQRPGDDVLTVSPSSYTEAFDAALEAARRNGMTAAVRDRRRGIIETDPAVAGSILEPWRPQSSLTSAAENTLAFQRRLARFEFTPFDSDNDDVSAAPSQIDGPDLLSLEQQQLDLLSYQGDIELRVWVYVERNYEPGLRRSTWSRGQTTRMVIVPPDPDDPPLPREYWIPVSRDSAYERMLLEQVRRSLAAADSAASAVSVGN